MEGRASIGVEIPCRKGAWDDAHVVVFLNGLVLCHCAPRAGRLVTPRSLGRAIRELIRKDEVRFRKLIANMPSGQKQRADDLVEGFKKWKEHVQENYLTTHYLRLQPIDHFQAFATPNAVRCQLMRQCGFVFEDAEPAMPTAEPAEKPRAKKQRTKKAKPVPEEPLATEPCHVRLVFIWPITPCLRLVDKVAVHLREPHYCERSQRFRPFATGKWWPVPEDHVCTRLCCGALLVVVE